MPVSNRLKPVFLPIEKFLVNFSFGHARMRAIQPQEE
jgi:hypothetical protein